MPASHEAQDDSDKLLQDTCKMIVDTVAEAVNTEPPGRTQVIKSESGQVLGRQLVIDASDRAEEKGMMNLCRLTALDPNASDVFEVARIEYEHDKKGKYGNQRIYSLASVRWAGGEMELKENFLADGPETVREADFEKISSESYAQQTVLGTLRDWTKYRLWQRGQGRN